MSKRFFAMAFAIGLVAVAWVGLGFVGSNWIALVMTAVIAAVYLLGAFELRQFRATSAALSGALTNMPQPPPSLGEWIERVPSSLRNTVRLRVEGERVGLPGPALTPYLVGLLVMLGMLGTFLGMVVTFKGAVFALEGSADLQAMRSALAAPIKGLGLAFGTSVAGVAASAMLGLMSAISQRERLEVARQLDGRIATTLKPFSLVHQRQETFRALQVQATALPQVFDKLDAMMERIERRSQQLDEQLLGRQAQFHGEVTLAYTELTRNVGASLQDSLAAGALAAGDSIRPVVESAMTQFVQDSQRMQARLADVAQTQVDALSQRFSDTASSVSDTWRSAQRDQAQAEQQRLQAWTQALQAMAADLHGQWQRVGDQTIAHQQAVCRALEQTAGDVAASASEQAGRTLDGMAQLLARSEALVQSRTESEAKWVEQHGQRMDQLAGLWHTQLSALRQDEAQRGQAAVNRLGELQTSVTQHLTTLRLEENQRGKAAVEQLGELRITAAQQLDTLRQEETRRGQAAAEQLGGLQATVAQHLGALRQEESQRGQAAVERLGELQAAVAQHLGTLGAALEAPLTRLLHTASEVPQAAAGVLAQLREEMSRLAERDNLALQERTVLLEHLGAMLRGVNQASGEQRAAIEALVTSASSMLDQAGNRFAGALEGHTGQAADMTAQVASSAIELASLGEAFGHGVQLFQASTGKLMDSLQQIEASLSRASARSDEQLAYYVAQAREVIDLSIASQDGLVANLRQLQGKPAALADGGRG